MKSNNGIQPKENDFFSDTIDFHYYFLFLYHQNTYNFQLKYPMRDIFPRDNVIKIMGYRACLNRKNGNSLSF